MYLLIPDIIDEVVGIIVTTNCYSGDYLIYCDCYRYCAPEIVIVGWWWVIVYGLIVLVITIVGGIGIVI